MGIDPICFDSSQNAGEIIDPRVRKAVSHYGHVPLMYALGDGTQHYPGTDTLWADKGNTFYAWLCDKRGYFKEYNLKSGI